MTEFKSIQELLYAQCSCIAVDENGRLFAPWELKSNITCPDTWERYDI